MALSTPRERPKRSTQKEDRYKMVLIGETGAGKTSFIEFLLNYAKQFGMESFDLDKVSSFVESNTEATGKESWESDTTQSEKYEANFGEFKLDIIDTPGFADTRGETQKKENIANIINKVKEELYVNCVCLVINGTQVRLTSVMSEVITAIVSILPPDVLRNIIIVFTKTHDKFSLKFDPKVLKDKFQLSIPKDRMFTVDNPYTRLQSFKESDEEWDENMKELLNTDFATAHKMLDKMHSLIKKLKPAVTLKFGEFYEATQDIELSLAEMRVIYENKEKVRKLMIETDLKKLTKVHYEKTNVTTSKSKHVVCIKSDCNQNCHKDCDCWFPFLLVGFCTQFTWGECKVCSHSAEDHKYVGYFFSTERREIVVPDHEKMKCLEHEMASYDKKESIESTTLELKLKNFQSLGSNGFFSENAKKQVEYLKKEIQAIPGTEWKPKINSMLDATLEVLTDPLTATDKDVKFRWACGLLGIDPDKVNDANISQLLRKRAKQFHPDASRDESTSGWFKHLNHAKEFLSSTVFGD